MKCPFCGEPGTRVVDSRPTDESTAIRRRRECVACLKRFTTYEKLESVPLVVIKKDGRREQFDLDKVLTGMVKACEKRPIPMEKLQELARDIEADLRNQWAREVPSSEIGERVMAKLKDVDDVAYVRFASVYRQFTDLRGFMEELQGLFRERQADGPPSKNG